MSLIVQPWQKPIRGTQLNRSHPLARGLKVCCSFNEATGGKVYDITGNGHHGTLENGADWVGSTRGRVVDCSGGDDYRINFGTGFPALGSAFTLAGWVSFANNDNNIPYIACRAYFANWSWRVYHNISGSTFYGGISTDGSEGGMTECTYSLGISYNQLYFWTFTGDGANITFYINGDPGTPVAAAFTAFAQPSRIVTINGKSDGAQDFDGMHDGFALWDRCLTPAEIQQLHREPYAMFVPSTKIWVVGTDIGYTGFTWGADPVTRSGHEKRKWDEWKKADSSDATFDSSYGKLQLEEGDTFYSPVVDFGDADAKWLEIDTDHYDVATEETGGIIQVVQSIHQKPIRGTMLNRSHPLARGLVRCFPMFEGIGSKTFDPLHIAFPGTTYNSPAWSGGGIVLERSSSQYVLFDNKFTVGSVTTGSRFSAAVGLRLGSVNASDQQTIYSNWGNPGNREWMLNITQNDTTLEFASNIIVTSNASLTLGKFHHVVLTFEENSGSDRIQIFLDGLLDKETTGNCYVATSDADGAIGARRHAGVDQYFDGVIYYVYVWDRCLTPSEVQQIHREPYAMFQPSRILVPVPSVTTGTIEWRGSDTLFEWNDGL